MPTYVYACDSCGKQFEKFQSFKDDPLTVCICGTEGKVRRVIQPAGIVFKGSGWYLTDSRGGSAATVSSETTKTETEKTSSDKVETTKAESTTSEKSSKSDSPSAATSDT